jgi:hypothetical protein
MKTLTVMFRSGNMGWLWTGGLAWYVAESARDSVSSFWVSSSDLRLLGTVSIVLGLLGLWRIYRSPDIDPATPRKSSIIIGLALAAYLVLERSSITSRWTIFMLGLLSAGYIVDWLFIVTKFHYQPARAEPKA